MEGYWSVKQLCKRYGVSRETLRRWMVRLGFPRPVHFGDPRRSKALFSIPLVLAWEERR
jgi:predicted DNA-binding transcriptional regulator AlpA